MSVFSYIFALWIIQFIVSRHLWFTKFRVSSGAGRPKPSEDGGKKTKKTAEEPLAA
jgi:hypothetical protein